MQGVATQSGTGRDAQALEPPARRAERAAIAGDVALIFAIGAVVAISGRQEGAYSIDAWAPLGLLLLCALGALVALRRRPALLPSLAAASLVAVGGWAVLSTQWGGIPNVAWTILGQSIVAAAALLAASALASDARRSTIVFAGVALGLIGQAVAVLVHLAVSGGPSAWFYGRLLEGPTGYHSAQATLFVLGLPFALVMAIAPRWYVRAAGGAACALLLAALVLTQSRGGLIAAAAAVIVVVAWARDLRLLLFSVPVVAAAAALHAPMRNVDAALVHGSDTAQVDELRRYILWSVLAALVLAAVAVANARSHTGRITVLAVACVCLLAGLGAGIHERAAIGRTIDRAASSSSDRASPDTAPAGATRIASLSSNGRREAWRISGRMLAEHPVAGAGAGQFSRHWGTDRHKSYFYFFILQPHSLELELLSELGIIGLGFFAAFVATAVLCAVRAVSRSHGAIAMAVLLALLAEATVDWTWSFPAVVLPVALTVGAAADPTRVRRLRFPGAIAVPVLAVAALVLVAPYLADLQLDRAQALASTNPDKAWDLSRQAERLNPWDDRVYELQGKIADSSRLYTLAAQKYEKSATLARKPWLGYFQAAYAEKTDGDKTAQAAACKRALAANPFDQLFRWDACAGVD